MRKVEHRDRPTMTPAADPPITSSDHAVVKRLVRLHEARHRRADGHFIAEGRRTIDAFLAAGWPAELLLVRSGEEVPAAWPPVRAMNERVAAKLSQASTASGYLAVFPIPAPRPVIAGTGGLVLVGISDPGNLGTLLRSAAAFAIPQVVVIGGADPFAHKTVQASAGALSALALSVLGEGGGPQALSGGAALCALVVAGGADPAAMARRPRWLVVGSEAHGLGADWLAACSERVTLAMPGAVESLNAAVAGSLACYLLAPGRPG
jgi:TrmH family RNA methyltransferase